MIRLGIVPAIKKNIEGCYGLLGRRHRLVRRTSTLAFATVLSFTAIVAGFTTALTLASVLALADVLFFHFRGFVLVLWWVCRVLLSKGGPQLRFKF